MTKRKGEWMQTRAGIAYWPGDPRSEDVLIDDIAHSLGMLCRYGGHCRRFYSVAEHCILVSYMVPREHALSGLLHDATEAYLVDLPRPVKMMLPEYRVIEERNWKAIARKFHIPEVQPVGVKDADMAICLAEQRALMTPEPAPWASEAWAANGKLPSVEINCYSPQVAASRFLDRFYELYEYNKGAAHAEVDASKA